MMITLVRAQKHRHSNELVPASDSDVIFITSLASGLISTSESDQRRFPHCRSGRRRMAGEKGYGRTTIQIQDRTTRTKLAAPAHDNRRNGAATTKESSLVRQIEALAEPLGKALYRGLLKSVARVWNPNQIQDKALQQRVLEHMQAAERGLQRLKSALERVGTEPLPRILNSLRVVSLEKVDSLETLKQIVLALEALPPRS